MSKETRGWLIATVVAGILTGLLDSAHSSLVEAVGIGAVTSAIFLLLWVARTKRTAAPEQRRFEPTSTREFLVGVVVSALAFGWLGLVIAVGLQQTWSGVLIGAVPFALLVAWGTTRRWRLARTAPDDREALLTPRRWGPWTRAVMFAAWLLFLSAATTGFAHRSAAAVLVSVGVCLVFGIAFSFGTDRWRSRRHAHRLPRLF